jgi:acetyltransferase-like isoleucine patch superfamily enzyme
LFFHWHFGAACGTPIVQIPHTPYATLAAITYPLGCILIPPFYKTGGVDINVGRNVFINQNGTVYDLGGLDIADDVMIGPNVSIITSGHPIEPSRRRAGVIAKPIVIEKTSGSPAGATIIGGVTVGENSLVAAGSVVTRDVPPNTLVGGNPARVIRSIAD